MRNEPFETFSRLAIAAAFRGVSQKSMIFFKNTRASYEIYFIKFRRRWMKLRYRPPYTIGLPAWANVSLNPG